MSRSSSSGPTRLPASRCHRPPRRPARDPLRPGVTTLGRRAENMIALSGDAYVSGRHAEIRCDQPLADLSGGCVLVDVGSTNGTFLARQPTGEEERLRAHDPQPLTAGDQIRLGQTTLTFQAAGAG